MVNKRKVVKAKSLRLILRKTILKRRRKLRRIGKERLRIDVEITLNFSYFYKSKKKRWLILKKDHERFYRTNTLKLI